MLIFIFYELQLSMEQPAFCVAHDGRLPHSSGNLSE
jgi:hypothetical protein